MTMKHQLVDKKQSLMNPQQGDGVAGGDQGDVGSQLSGLGNMAGALNSAGVGLPALNEIGTQVMEIASSLTGVSNSLIQQLNTIGSQMSTSGMGGGMTSLVSQLQSVAGQIQSALGGGQNGKKANVLHHRDLDKSKGAKTGAFQDKHTTTWDSNGVTHSSGNSVTSTAPTIPHNGNTNVSDNLNVSKTTTANNYVTSSDGRLKTDIAPLHSVLDKVLALRVVTFMKRLIHRDRKNNASIHSDPPHHDFGLIAQDVRKILPQAVHGDESKEFLGIAEGKIAMLLLAAFQEYVAKTDARLAALEAKLNGK